MTEGELEDRHPLGGAEGCRGWRYNSPQDGRVSGSRLRLSLKDELTFRLGFITLVGYHHVLMIFIALAIILLCKWLQPNQPGI